MIVFITILTLFLPVVMLPVNLFLYVKDKEHSTVYVFLISFAMAAIAFNFTPYNYQNTDILRHFSRMENIIGVTFEDSKNMSTFSGLPLYYWLLKIFSYASNKQLLPAFTTFIGYYLCLFVVNKMDTRDNESIRFLSIFLFLSGISLLGFCSGIRQYLIFAIFVFAFYYEVVKKKFRLLSWIVYFLLLTLHTSAGFLIILRVVAGIFNRFKLSKLLVALVLLWGYTQEIVVNFLESHFSGNRIVDKIVEYFDFYGEFGSAFIPYAYIWRFALLVFCTFVVIHLIKKSNESKEFPRVYLYMALSVCMFTFGGFASYDIFSRFSMFCFMLILPLLPKFFSTVILENRSVYLLGLTLFSALVLVYNITQYATFHFEGLLEVLTTNIFTFIGAI